MVLAARIKKRMIPLVCIAVFAAALVLGFCQRSSGEGMISIGNTFQNLWGGLRLAVMDLLHLPVLWETQNAVAAQPDYQATLNNLNSVFVTAAAGAVLAVAGAAYQTIFRNPLAVPTMLGVTGGIDLGLLLLVAQFGTTAVLMDRERYLYTYLLGLGMAGASMLAGKLMGKGKTEITNMLLVGVLFSSFAELIITYFQFNMTQETLLVLQGFTLGRLTAFSGASLQLFTVCCCVGLLPLVLMRFSIDVLGFGDDGARTMGLRPGFVRAAALLSATLLVTTATIHCGSIGLLALVVPHICRRLFSCRFAVLLPSCMLVGAALLLFCRAISTALNAWMGYIPVNVFVSVMGAPLLFFLLVKQRRKQV